MFRSSGLIRKVVANNGFQAFAKNHSVKVAAASYANDNSSSVR